MEPDVLDTSSLGTMRAFSNPVVNIGEQAKLSTRGSIHYC